MNKIWGMILIGLSMNSLMQAENQTEEWRNMVKVTKGILTTDVEMQQAAQKTIAEFQNMLSILMKKITHQVSPVEKEKIIVMVQALNRMVDLYGDAIRSDSAIDAETAEELRQLGQELTIFIMPLMFLAQDPIFVNEQIQLLQNLRIETYNQVKRTLNQLTNDIQSK